MSNQDPKSVKSNSTRHKIPMVEHETGERLVPFSDQHKQDLPTSEIEIIDESLAFESVAEHVGGMADERLMSEQPVTDADHAEIDIDTVKGLRDQGVEIEPCMERILNDFDKVMRASEAVTAEEIREFEKPTLVSRFRELIGA